MPHKQGIQQGLGHVLVTVGTTRFDELTQAADSMELVRVLQRKGYSKLLLQIGSSSHVPQHLCPTSEPDDDSGKASITNDDGSMFQIEWFRYTPVLKTIINDCDLVISHAGAGSIFETLSSGAGLITVPNESLMDNHQMELANHLHRLGHLQVATTRTLVDVVEQFDWRSLKPYIPQDGSAIAKDIDKELGY